MDKSILENSSPASAWGNIVKHLYELTLKVMKSQADISGGLKVLVTPSKDPKSCPYRKPITACNGVQ